MLMGILADLEVTPIGARFPNGWIVISNGSSDGASIDFYAAFFASRVSKEQGYNPVAVKKFTIPYQAGDLVSICYGHLMTLNLDETFNQDVTHKLKVNISAGELVDEDPPVPPELPAGEPQEG